MIKVHNGQIQTQHNSMKGDTEFLSDMISKYRSGDVFTDDETQNLKSVLVKNYMHAFSNMLLYNAMSSHFIARFASGLLTFQSLANFGFQNFNVDLTPSELRALNDYILGILYSDNMINSINGAINDFGNVNRIYMLAQNMREIASTIVSMNYDSVDIPQKVFDDINDVEIFCEDAIERYRKNDFNDYFKYIAGGVVNEDDIKINTRVVRLMDDDGQEYLGIFIQSDNIKNYRLLYYSALMMNAFNTIHTNLTKSIVDRMSDEMRETVEKITEETSFHMDDFHYDVGDDAQIKNRIETQSGNLTIVLSNNDDDDVTSLDAFTRYMYEQDETGFDYNSDGFFDDDDDEGDVGSFGWI